MVVQTKPEPYCPDCGIKMVLRTRRSDDAKFWGCPDYPECRGTRDIGSDGKPVFDEAREFEPRDFGGY